MIAFKKGDRVVCVDAPHDFFGQLESNAEYTVSSVLGNGAVCIAGRPHLSFHPSRFRLSQPSAPLGEVYGTMPEVLPETLPAGVRVRSDHRDGSAVALAPVELQGGDHYRGDWDVAGVTHRGIFYMADSLDWSTIPRAQPDAKEGGPEVGERWIGWSATHGDEEVTVVRKDGESWLCAGGKNRWYGYDGGVRRPGSFSLLRRISPAQPEAYTPAVGDEVEGVGAGDGVTPYRGTVVRVIPAGQFWQHAALELDVPFANCIRLDSARLIRRASAPTDATGGKCRHRNVNLVTMRCDDCGMSDKEVREATKDKPDPYHKPEEAPPRWLAEQNAKHAALIAKHKADFDRVRTPANRKAAERLKAEVAETLKSWPERDGWEP